MSTHADPSFLRRPSGDTRATEIGDLLARLVLLVSEQSPHSEAPVPQLMPARVLLTVEEAAQRLHMARPRPMPWSRPEKSSQC